jgi:DNA-directed RNA polymerase subunit H
MPGELLVKMPKLIPEHELLSASDAKKVARKFNVAFEKFSKILETDPQAKKLGAKPGNLIAIQMEDPTGSYTKYRLVVKG